MNRKGFILISIIAGLLLLWPALAFAGGQGEEAGGEQQQREEQPAEMPDNFEGQTVTVFTQNPPFIAKPVQMFGPDWEEETGGTIEMVNSPFQELYQQMYTSMSLGQNRFDLMLFPASWLATFAQNDFLAPLDQYIQQDEDLNWEGVLETYRGLTQQGGNTYAIPIDADNHLFYYRKDALENEEYQQQFADEYGYEMPVPPKTWSQVRDIAEFFDEWDWDGDGQEEYGVVEAMRSGGQAYWTYFSRTTGYAAVPGKPGGLFFNPNNMEPLIDNPAHVESLKDWIEIKEYGVPGILNMDSGEIRQVFVAGEAAMVIDWGDIGVLAATGEQSKVAGKVGYSILPGAERAWDYENEEWLQVSENPDMFVGDEYNRAPYLAFGGWFGAIDANSDVIPAAYDFLSYLANPEHSYTLVTTDETGCNPFRERHFEQMSRWRGLGFEDPEPYLEAVRNTITHPNVQPDLQIPEANRYFEAIEAQLLQALAGSKSPEEALSDAADEWETITEDVGRESQLQAYRASLGLSTE
jgi:multiple sugar transport system substrate-binding protein